MKKKERKEKKKKNEKQKIVVALPVSCLDPERKNLPICADRAKGRIQTEKLRHKWRAPSPQVLLRKTSFCLLGVLLMWIHTPLHILCALALFSPAHTVLWQKPTGQATVKENFQIVMTILGLLYICTTLLSQYAENLYNITYCIS